MPLFKALQMVYNRNMRNLDSHHNNHNNIHNDITYILGIPVHNLTEDEAMARIATFLASPASQRRGHQIVTTNPEFVMEAQRNPSFRDVLCHADLSVPDGFGLLLASHWYGTPLRGRVTGVSLTNHLAALAAKKGYRIFFLGAAPGVAEEAATVLQTRYPGLQCAGCYAGSPYLDEEPAIREMIHAAQPDILLVAYGHPAQDLWIARNQPMLNIPVAMGVGGVFDYLSGRVPLAPPWVRKMGLEWLYRLIKQPSRWRRIWVAVPLFSWRVVWSSRTSHHV